MDQHVPGIKIPGLCVFGFLCLVVGTLVGSRVACLLVEGVFLGEVDGLVGRGEGECGLGWRAGVRGEGEGEG